MVQALSPFRQHCPNCHWHGPVIQGHRDAVIVSDWPPRQNHSTGRLQAGAD